MKVCGVLLATGMIALLPSQAQASVVELRWEAVFDNATVPQWQGTEISVEVSFDPMTAVDVVANPSVGNFFLNDALFSVTLNGQAFSGSGITLTNTFVSPDTFQNLSVSFDEPAGGFPLSDGTTVSKLVISAGSSIGGLMVGDDIAQAIDPDVWSDFIARESLPDTVAFIEVDDLDTTGSLATLQSFAVVPAPGSAVVLAGVALVASRRRCD